MATLTRQPLTREDLRATREELRELSDTLFDESLDRLNTRESDEFKQLIASKRMVDDKIVEITSAIFTHVLVDIQSPETAIKQSISRVNQAIRSVDEVNKKLKILQPLLSLLDTVIVAAKTFSIANIGNLVDQIALLPGI